MKTVSVAATIVWLVFTSNVFAALSGSSLSWQSISNMMTARDQFAGCVIGDKIYVFGGNGNPDGDNLKSGEVWDIGTPSWSSIADNPHTSGIEELTGVSVNGKFYVFGASFNEAYNPASNTWATLAPNAARPAVPVAAVYGGKIYLFSASKLDPCNVVDVYDPVGDSWGVETHMPKMLCDPAIAVYNGSAYVIGGLDGNDGTFDTFNTEVMAYNFASKTWTRNYCTASADAARVYSYASMTPVIDGKAYLTGGVEANSLTNHWVSNKVTAFNIDAKTWESLAALPEARNGHLAVAYDKTLYVIGGEVDETDINSARSSVYAYRPDSLDLTGEYWFGSLSADSGGVPWSKRGTVSITGWNWHQEWDDQDGHHTFSSPFTTSFQSDGSIDIILSSGPYNVAWNGNAMIHAGDTLGGGIGIDMIMRKATNVQMSDVLGDHRFFGHYLSTSDRDDSAVWGNVVFDSDGSFVYTHTNDHGVTESGTMNWTLDGGNAMIVVPGTSPGFLCKGGITLASQVVAAEGRDGDLGYNLFVKKTSQAIIPADMAGTYQVRFLETGPGGVPYTCGQGTGILRADGTFSTDAYYSDGTHDTKNGTFTIGPGNTFSIAGIPEQGIISADLGLIFLPEYVCSSPRNSYDWIGGIFLIRNTSPLSNPPSGTILWQAVKAPFGNNIGYLIHSRITISDMKACSLKGPNMADFVPAVWVPQRGQWSLEIGPMTLGQLQQKSLGAWELKLTNTDDQESVYSFTILGALEASEFLPMPTMIEPALGDSNVIAEHNTVRWSPNGAQAGADALVAEMAGQGFFYYSTTLDVSATEWNPGWLEIGNAYCKVGYADYRPDMIDTPAHVSGPAINWESYMASLVSGPRNNFCVKYSLDLIDDDHIDIKDLSVFYSHWLETSPNIADFDDDGVVTFDDFAIFSQHWLEGR